MKSIFALVLFYIAVSMSSCTQDIEIEMPPYTPQITLNCLFDTTDVFTVNLTKSQSIEESSFTPFESISNADVYLYQENGILEKLYLDSAGRYKSTGKPYPGHTYRLKVDAPDLESVETSTYLNSGSDFDNFSVYDSIRTLNVDTNNTAIYNYRVKFDLADNPNEKNFYLFNVVMIDTFYDSTTGISSVRRTPVNIIPDVAFFTEASTSLSSFSYVSLEDVSLDGQNQELKMTVDARSFSTGALPKKKKLELTIISSSSDYYNYQKSLDVQIVNTIDFIFSATPLFDNIKNGFGIFAGSKTDKIIIPL